MRRTLAQRLAAQIAVQGPITVAQYMAVCLYDPVDGYYAARPRLGADFTTAPEISQIFGELIGLWCVQSWLDLGSPQPFNLVELGPGRGVMMADAMRAARIVPGFLDATRLTFVETSAPLRAEQQARLQARSVESLEAVEDGPILLVANEFLDCMPIRQFVRVGLDWRERLIGADAEGALIWGLSPDPAPLGALFDPGAIDSDFVEAAPALPSFVASLAARLRKAPGRALLIDYGSPSGSKADTLQAIRGGEKVPALAFPGESDLTAHVDFARLKALAAAEGLSVYGPIPQGALLTALGIEARANTLAQSNPGQAHAIGAALHRLTHEDEMGVLFQAICLAFPDTPPPPGFFT